MIQRAYLTIRTIETWAPMITLKFYFDSSYFLIDHDVDYVTVPNALESSFNDTLPQTLPCRACTLRSLHTFHS